MTVDRIMGTETEYGIYRPGSTEDPVWLSTDIVAAYAATYRQGTEADRALGGQAAPVRWDYSGEDPLNDLRGTRLPRVAADPSMLTDDPERLAPSGGEYVAIYEPTEPSFLPAATSAVLTNGARVYVDHAHPEYSAPETRGPRDAVLWDRAGDLIAQRMMRAVTDAGRDPIILVKNNTDGKGASYGAHENYQMRRDTDFDDLVRAITPFFIVRPVVCGAGRVGIGPASERPGFQISQRADFVENHVGLETTFNRPIINTRDEPHADSRQFRRFHVIGGDANLFDMSAYLRFGTTALVLWAIEQGVGLEWDALTITDPVPEVWAVSHHPHLDHQLTTITGATYTPLEFHRLYHGLVCDTFNRLGMTPDADTQDVLDQWVSVIDRMSADVFSVSTEVEWVGKYQLLSRQKERLGCSWDDPRLAAMDVQWSDLRTERSLVAKLDAAGLVTRLFTPQQVAWAADNPPQNTRAKIRGDAVRRDPSLIQASWTSLVVREPHTGRLIRRPLADARHHTTPTTHPSVEG